MTTPQNPTPTPQPPRTVQLGDRLLVPYRGELHPATVERFWEHETGWVALWNEPRFYLWLPLAEVQALAPAPEEPTDPEVSQEPNSLATATPDQAKPAQLSLLEV